MCKITAAQIQADGKVVGDAVLQIAKLVQATDPPLAAQLTSAANALISVTSTWQEGDAVAILQDAEQAVIVVLNLIPVTAPYASFVAIAFAGLSLLIANSAVQPQLTGKASKDTLLLLHTEETTNTSSPWHDKATIEHHWMNPPRKDFESAWNGEVDAQPTVGIAKITL